MTESTTSKMDNLQQKHDEIGTCSCKDCHHSRMERIQKERKQLQLNRYILQNTNYGHIHYVHHVTMERTSELSIQPVTAMTLKINVHEVQPTTVDGAKGQDINDVQIEETEFQVNEPNQQVNNQENVAVINENCLLLDAQEPEFDQMKKDMRNKTVYITIEPQTEEMELTHYGHATIEEIPVLMQEDKCKLNVEKYLLMEGLHMYYEIVWIYNTKIKNLLNQNGHSMNICWNKLLCSSLKEEPPERQTLGHFWDKNWMPLIKNEFLFII